MCYLIYILLFWLDIKLMDLYTMGRMFRKYDSDSNKYRNIIFHGGAFHTNNYSKILTELGLVAEIEHTSGSHCIELDEPFDYVNYTNEQYLPSFKHIFGGRKKTKKKRKYKKRKNSKKKK